MKNNSRNIYQIFGNDKEKVIDPARLSFQHKLMHYNLNFSPRKPRIYRNSTTKEIKKKLLQKRKSISHKKKENVIYNQFLEYKHLSMNRNKFGSISTNNSINLTYQKKPKVLNNYYAINNLKESGSLFRYKRKYKKVLNSNHENLMPVLLTERKERTKYLNKNEKNALNKSKKRTNIFKKIELDLNHKSNSPNLYHANKKQKIHKSISTFELNILNNFTENIKFDSNKNKNVSILTKNYFKGIENNNNISILTPKKNKRLLKFNKIFLNEHLIIKANPLKLGNNKIFTIRINELEDENKKLKEEINKMKKELEDKDEIIKKQELKIKEHENIIEEIIINTNKELEKLMDEKEKIKSIIPFEILPEEKIMSIIFKSDD